MILNGKFVLKLIVITFLLSLAFPAIHRSPLVRRTLSSILAKLAQYAALLQAPIIRHVPKNNRPS
jgi:hypothetical protein